MVWTPNQRRMMDLVGADDGLVSREIFYDPDIYEQEQERVFHRAWLFIGHESQIPNPNDFFVSRMGEESVIMTRDRQGNVHVLLNTCRHRGMRVCRYDEGNTPVFSCPYHGWSYSTDGNLVSVPGELIGVPQFRTAYYGELEKEEWGLISVPQMANYKGFIWANWDKDAPSFDDYIGDFKYYLDGLYDKRDGSPGGAQVIGGVQKWRVPCNWKFSAENFQGDMYHNISHTSVELVGIGPGGNIGRHGEDEGARGGRMGIVSFPELGHGARGGPPDAQERPFPKFRNAVGPTDDVEAVGAYFEKTWLERDERLKGKPRSSVGGNVFPNMSFHAGFPRGILLTHPVGPMEMEMWRFYIVDADAPKEVKDLIRHYGLRYSGPAGLTEQDDMENWNYAAAASKGRAASRFPYNYTMGKGHTTPVPGLKDAVITEHRSNEENVRTLYRRWAEFMDADSWDDIFPKRKS